MNVYLVFQLMRIQIIKWNIIHIIKTQMFLGKWTCLLRISPHFEWFEWAVCFGITFCVSLVPAEKTYTQPTCTCSRFCTCVYSVTYQREQVRLHSKSIRDFALRWCCVCSDVSRLGICICSRFICVLTFVRSFARWNVCMYVFNAAAIIITPRICVVLYK